MNRLSKRVAVLWGAALLAGVLPVSHAAEYTVTRVSWDGASAEELKSELLAHAPTLKLAIVHDERAQVFHEASVADVTAAFERDKRNQPVGFEVGKTTKFEGPLPACDKFRKEQVAKLRPKADTMRKLGITMVDLSRQLQDTWDYRDPELVKKLLTKKLIRTPGGQDVPLSSVVEIRLVTVVRPLVLRN